MGVQLLGNGAEYTCLEAVLLYHNYIKQNDSIVSRQAYFLQKNPFKAIFFSENDLIIISH